MLAARSTENRAVACSPSIRATANLPRSGTYVITALRPAVPGVDAGVLQLLQSAQPPIETAPAALLNELSAVPNDVHLALDDYRFVDGPEIWSALISYCLRLIALAIRSA
jgi:LuxR family maltose regulon positive regulatory protein